MAENSKIEWCDHTFNPWEGCTKVSDGCKHCYAEARANRFGTVKWGPAGQRRRTSAANWRKPLKWNKQAKAEGRRFRVFCASLADVFEIHPSQDLDEWRHDLFVLIQKTPYLDWLLLTKRPENIMPYLMHGWGTDLPDNVWVGTSVENQQAADERIPHLLKVPAAVRFLSIEPLLGPVDIRIYMATGWTEPPYDDIVNWVIVGGESGPNARPMHPDWARGVRDQCVAAGVPFFFKQWGEWAPNCLCDTKYPHLTVNRPYGYKAGVMFKCGKAGAGRRLDSREWSQYPTLDHNGQPVA